MNSGLESIEHIERVTLAEHVYAQLRDLLTAGKLAPGDKLSLRTVARTIGVSMMPVREAVIRLLAEDALSVSPNRSVRVPVMTLSKLRELTLVRCEIEGFAAARAAEHRSKSDLQKIADLDDKFRKEFKVGDAGRALELNRDLHFAIYKASASPILFGIIEGLWLKVGPAMNLDLRSTEQRLRTGKAEQFHKRIVAAIKAGQSEAARDALAADIATSSEFLQKSQEFNP